MSPITFARNYFIPSTSKLTISSDNNDLGIVTPISEEITKNIQIKYDYGRWARPKGFPRPNSKESTSIEVSIFQQPSWCEISFDETQFSAPIGNMLQAGSVTFNATLIAKITDATADAFNEGNIIVNATAEENGNIAASYTTYELTIAPDFVPSVYYTLSNTSISLKPGENTNLSIFVENKGNSKIEVEITSNISDYDPITINLPNKDQIDVKNNIEFPISITALSNDNATNKSINVCVNITYYSVSDPNVNKITACIPVTFDIVITDEDFVDLTIYVIGIFAAFIVIFLILTVVFWIRREQ
jgi:hypothetical protein